MLAYIKATLKDLKLVNNIKATLPIELAIDLKN